MRTLCRTILAAEVMVFAAYGAETHTETAGDGGFIITGKSSNRYIKLLPKHWMLMFSGSIRLTSPSR